MEASAFFEVCKYYPRTSSLGCVKAVMDNLENKSDRIKGAMSKEEAMKVCADFIVDKIVPKIVHWKKKDIVAVDDIVKSYISNYLLFVAKYINRNILDNNAVAEKMILYRFPSNDLDHLRSESRHASQSDGLYTTYRHMGLKVHTIEEIHRDVLIDSQYENNKTYYDIPRCMVNRPMREIPREQYDKRWKQLENAIEKDYSVLHNYVTIQDITMENVIKHTIDRRRSLPTSPSSSNNPRSLTSPSSSNNPSSPTSPSSSTPQTSESSTH
jgi:hypothetical protein